MWVWTLFKGCVFVLTACSFYSKTCVSSDTECSYSFLFDWVNPPSNKIYHDDWLRLSLLSYSRAAGLSKACKSFLLLRENSATEFFLKMALMSFCSKMFEVSYWKWGSSKLISCWCFVKWLFCCYAPGGRNFPVLSLIVVSFMAAWALFVALVSYPSNSRILAALSPISSYRLVIISCIWTSLICNSLACYFFSAEISASASVSRFAK